MLGPLGHWVYVLLKNKAQSVQKENGSERTHGEAKQDMNFIFLRSLMFIYKFAHPCHRQWHERKPQKVAPLVPQNPEKKNNHYYYLETWRVREKWERREKIENVTTEGNGSKRRRRGEVGGGDDFVLLSYGIDE